MAGPAAVGQGSSRGQKLDRGHAQSIDNKGFDPLITQGSPTRRPGLCPHTVVTTGRLVGTMGGCGPDGQIEKSGCGPWTLQSAGNDLAGGWPLGRRMGGLLPEAFAGGGGPRWPLPQQITQGGAGATPTRGRTLLVRVDPPGDSVFRHRGRGNAAICNTVSLGWVRGVHLPFEPSHNVCRPSLPAGTA